MDVRYTVAYKDRKPEINIMQYVYVWAPLETLNSFAPSGRQRPHASFAFTRCRDSNFMREKDECINYENNILLHKIEIS